MRYGHVSYNQFSELKFLLLWDGFVVVQKNQLLFHPFGRLFLKQSLITSLFKKKGDYLIKQVLIINDMEVSNEQAQH